MNKKHRSYKPHQTYKRHYRVRTKVKAQNFNSIIKLVIWTFLLATIISAGVFVYSKLFANDKFRIKEINLVGLTSVPSAEFIAKLPVKINDNIILSFFKRKIEKNIKSIYPQIRHFSISRRFPDKLNIKIVERTPVCYLTANNNIYYGIDENNVLFSFIPSSNPAIGRCYGPELSISSNTGQNREVVIAFIESIKKKNRRLFDSIGTISMKKNNDLILSLTDYTSIIWGEYSKSETESKLDYLERVISKKQFEKLEYIDLRLTADSRVVIKPAEIKPVRQKKPVPQAKPKPKKPKKH